MQMRAATQHTTFWPTASTRWFFAVAWITLCAAGSYWAMRYDFQTGRLGPSLAEWPMSSALTRSPDRTTVVVFLHPRCVCSRATVTQLVRTLATHPDVAFVVSVFVPRHAADRREWEQADHVARLRTVRPDAAIFYDPGGIEAQRFGAPTSGTVLVYDPHGRELFRGGITDRRGGEGENRGRKSLARVLESGNTAIRSPSTPVFGCPLVPTIESAGSEEHE